MDCSIDVVNCDRRGCPCTEGANFLSEEGSSPDGCVEPESLEDESFFTVPDVDDDELEEELEELSDDLELDSLDISLEEEEEGTDSTDETDPSPRDCMSLCFPSFSKCSSSSPIREPLVGEKFWT